MRNRVVTVAVVWGALLLGCASVSTDSKLRENKNDAAVKGDSWSGPKKRLQVIQFDLPRATLDAYPELAEKRIGWGLCNRLVDAFYETGRFEFVEEKDEMIGRILKTWALSQSGAVSESTAVQPGGLSAPEYLVYAEVYDFSISTQETMVTVAAQQNRITRLGIQIRLVDVKTGQFIPSSGIGEVTVRKNAVIWAADQKDFDQSTVGQASQLALNTAVNTLIKRLPF